MDFTILHILLRIQARERHVLAAFRRPIALEKELIVGIPCVLYRNAMDEDNDDPHVGLADLRILSRIQARERRVLAACRSPIA